MPSDREESNEQMLDRMASRGLGRPEAEARADDLKRRARSWKCPGCAINVFDGDVCGECGTKKPKKKDK